LCEKVRNFDPHRVEAPIDDGLMTCRDLMELRERVLIRSHYLELLLTPALTTFSLSLMVFNWVWRSSRTPTLYKRAYRYHIRRVGRRQTIN
jgi:hypothetical protein